MTNKNFRIVQDIAKSLSIGIPAKIAKQLKIRKGDVLCVSLVENKIVVEPLEPSKVPGVPEASDRPIKESAST